MQKYEKTKMTKSMDYVQQRHMLNSNQRTEITLKSCFANDIQICLAKTTCANESCELIALNGMQNGHLFCNGLSQDDRSTKEQ